MNAKQLAGNRDFWAGIILISCLALLLFLVHLRKEFLAPQAQFELFAIFNKVDGITEGSVVRLSGTPVGQVSQMELDPYYRIKMTLSFPKPIALPDDTAAIIETNGLVGNKHIELVPGGNDKMLENGETIVYTQDVLLLDELLSRFLEWMRLKKGIVGTEPIKGEN